SGHRAAAPRPRRLPLPPGRVDRPVARRSRMRPVRLDARPRPARPPPPAHHPHLGPVRLPLDPPDRRWRHPMNTLTTTADSSADTDLAAGEHWIEHVPAARTRPHQISFPALIEPRRHHGLWVRPRLRREGDCSIFGVFGPTRRG